MKHRLITILSLILFTAAEAGPAARPFMLNAHHPTPVYSPDGAVLITSPSVSGDQGLENLISLSMDIYPIQIGAFRVKTYAERMYARVADVIGNDVIMIEEDGFYKIRVTRLDKAKILSSLESETVTGEGSQADNPVPSDVKKESIPVSADTALSVSDTALVSNDTIPGVLMSAPQVEMEPSVTEITEMPKPKFFLLNSDSPWLQRINYFGKSFALVNALIITIMVSILTMIILLMVILLNRTRMEKQEDLKQYLAETYQGMIIDYLFTGSSPDRFRSIASDNYRRQALIDQMIDVSVNLKGDAEEKLGGLYLYLGLDRDSIKRANDYRWHKKIKGFRELAFMNIKDANHSIYKALNSKNEILRMEAQIALVRLTDDDPFGFLMQLKKPFSLWEQITLHELIIQHDLPVPEFSKFLKADNPTVVMFALRMIREFKQKDSEDDVREALDHPSQEVRKLAVQVAGDLEMHSTLEVMKRMYKSQDYNTCLEIIRAMAKMPDPSLMGFLRLVLDKEDDVQLQIEATKAIENHGEEGVKTLVKLMKSEYKNYNIIVRHVLDRRIF
ncbi:MAG: HEAT repeat domain-containing protein [Bacteroidales bacterium]|jgi:HEAT repeat protein|nr:HEAT repeat domain-containing protein [Bacteroidales bacterium]